MIKTKLKLLYFFFEIYKFKKVNKWQEIKRDDKVF